MNALRSANFLKLSSSSSVSELYCEVSMSAGTPAGYFLSQMRSMGLSLKNTARPLRSHRTGLRLLADSIGNDGRCGKRQGAHDGIRPQGNSLNKRGLGMPFEERRARTRYGAAMRPLASVLRLRRVLRAVFLGGRRRRLRRSGVLGRLLLCGGLRLRRCFRLCLRDRAWRRCARSRRSFSSCPSCRRTAWPASSAATAATSAAPERFGPV